MKYGFVKVAAATPKIKVADTFFNANQAIEISLNAHKNDVEVLVFPELCITGYTCSDLFFQNSLRKGAIDALIHFAKNTKYVDALIFIGMPLVFNNSLYNCAVALQNGEILGVIPKIHLPNYGEFYEMRQFTEATPELKGEICIDGKIVPFGTKMQFVSRTNSNLVVSAEICEDVWSPNPPSIGHALAGATIIVNLSAGDEIIGKASYRKSLISGQSGRLICGYVYANAGDGESTTDMVFSGHNLIAENGTILAETELFNNKMIISEIDVEKISNERLKNTTFRSVSSEDYVKIPFNSNETTKNLTRFVSSSPFVPYNRAEKHEISNEILTIQAKGLAKRFEHTNAKSAVIGISGGLDSTLALLVTVMAFNLLDKPLSDIIAITMPCFGTTIRTKTNAEKLCSALGVTLKEVNIHDTVYSNFEDIGHDENIHDVTFENVQARVRTLVLMNFANKSNGLVIGTGDLSELALGFATYNGDHMSMYAVNSSIPKTLIRHLVDYFIYIADNLELKTVLKDVLDTPVSPELLPAKDGEISQQTEEIVGPYDLHDFFLYYLVRLNFQPKKIYFLAKYAFKGEFSDETILKWLEMFLRRFFSQQFKRSCIPDGPKVGSVTVSPRADLRMPSDAMATLWLNELEELKNSINKNK